MVSKGTAAQVGFIGAMIVGVLQVFAAPLWGSLSDKIGRRKTYIGGCIAFALLLYPTSRSTARISRCSSGSA